MDRYHTGRIPCEDKDRDWGDAPTNRETPKIASKPRKLEERQGQILPHCSHMIKREKPHDSPSRCSKSFEKLNSNS